MTVAFPIGPPEGFRDAPAWTREGLSAESSACLVNLLRHKAQPATDLGKIRQSAVLVTLYEKPGDDQLSVLLTTRSKALRRHPSQTALPGGKVDPEDPSVMHTARREAHEEIALPLESESIHDVAVLDPIITILPLNSLMRQHIIVFPSICYVSDYKIIEALRPAPDEVDMIFSHPLKGCHAGVLSEAYTQGLVDIGGDWWPHDEEYHNIENRIGLTGTYAMHRFRTVHSPIKGLTSDVLMDVAAIAYGAPPTFQRFAPSQPPFSQVITQVLHELPRSLELEAAEAKNCVQAPRKPMEWGLMETGASVLSGEKWHDKAE